jgi:hypothetical protein
MKRTRLIATFAAAAMTALPCVASAQSWISSNAMAPGTGQEFSGAFQFDETPSVLSFSTGPNVDLDEVAVGANVVVATPEPASVVLMASGLAGIAGVALRRRKRRSS